MSTDPTRFSGRAATASWTSRGYGVRYPSPFFDVAQQFLPENVHQLHLWCRFYFLTNPVINVACQKMAEYPVTPLVWETDDAELKKLYTSLEAHLRLRQFQVEIGLDYNVYGNGFASVFFQLEKYLVCRGCKERYRASKNRSLYKWKNGRFFLRCATCHVEDYADQADTYPRNVRGARLIRWNPENIEIKHNEVTGTSRYYYRLPRSVTNDVRLGDPETIETLPYQFLEAARTGKALLFHPDNFFHLKRPTIAQKDQGWGSPLIFPLLKDAFYLQIMKKAQESLLLEHVVPLRIVFPGPTTGGNDGPFGAYNLTNWKQKIDVELAMWKRDHNYIPILPMNIGFQQIGGQAKALILHQEFRIHAEQMLAGAGIPVEFVYGGLQWSSSNTSLRALENTFLGYNIERFNLTRFVVDKVAAHMGWPTVPFRFEKFRMADDLQRAMFYFQLNQAQKVSDQRLLEEIGEDWDTESERIAGERTKQIDAQRKSQLATAEIQGAALLRTSRYQAKANELTMLAQNNAQMQTQQDMAAAGMAQPGQPGADPNAQAGAPAAGAPPAAGGDPAGGAPATDPAAAGPPAPVDPNAAPPVGGPSLYAENADTPNASAAPTAMSGMESPLQSGQGGMDLRYVAQRAAAYLRTVEAQNGKQAMNQELEKLQMENPPIYQLVVQLLNNTGAVASPTDAMKSPITPRSASQRDSSRTVG
jgi:hypothetical protein